MTHIEWHRAMHEQQRQIKERAKLLAVAVGAAVTAFFIGLYYGNLL